MVTLTIRVSGRIRAIYFALDIFIYQIILVSVVMRAPHDGHVRISLKLFYNLEIMKIITSQISPHTLICRSRLL
jgi:hypothetical protein